MTERRDRDYLSLASCATQQILIGQQDVLKLVVVMRRPPPRLLAHSIIRVEATVLLVVWLRDLMDQMIDGGARRSVTTVLVGLIELHLRADGASENARQLGGEVRV